MNKQRLNEIKEQLEGTAIIGELYVKGDPWKGYEVIDNHNRMLIGEFSNKNEAELLASAPIAISELVNEVERLREALVEIENSSAGDFDSIRQMAHRALEGDSDE